MPIVPLVSDAIDTTDTTNFLAAVHAAARTCPPWAPGAGAVYISDVYDAGDWGGLDAFKRRLVEAARDGLLDLSEGQLVAAMDAERLARSEVRLGAFARRHLLRA